MSKNKRGSFADNAAGSSWRRRVISAEDADRILAAVDGRETSMADIARSFGLHPNMISKLRREREKRRALDTGESDR